MANRRFAFILAAGAALALAVADIPAAQAGGKSGGGPGMKSGMGHTGVPRPTGNSLGGKPLAGKGADIGQANPSGGMNNPPVSRRDRRGQPQPQADVGKGPKPRVVLGCHRPAPHRGCRRFDPYQEFPNRRAQVRDHR